MAKVLNLAITDLSTAVKVLQANPMRTSALFVNDSDTTMYLSLGINAAVNTGIRLNSGGGSYEINRDNLWRGEVYGICAAAAKTLLVTEVSG